MVSKSLVNLKNKGILDSILVIRDQRVMMDRSLAKLYGVPTYRLNEAVKRNTERFPKDFMFRLTDQEHESLISQNAISNKSRGGRRFAPYVFTEQGVAMLSSVLKSRQAVKINVAIMRTFVQIRRILESNKELAEKFIELKAKHDTKDALLKNIYAVIDKMLAEEAPKKRIGFKVD